MVGVFPPPFFDFALQFRIFQVQMRVLLVCVLHVLVQVMLFIVVSVLLFMHGCVFCVATGAMPMVPFCIHNLMPVRVGQCSCTVRLGVDPVAFVQAAVHPTYLAVSLIDHPTVDPEPVTGHNMTVGVD